MSLNPLQRRWSDISFVLWILKFLKSHSSLEQRVQDASLCSRSQVLVKMLLCIQTSPKITTRLLFSSRSLLKKVKHKKWISLRCKLRQECLHSPSVECLSQVQRKFSLRVSSVVRNKEIPSRICGNEWTQITRRQIWCGLLVTRHS